LTVRITITARHCDISEDLRARARTRLQRLGQVASRPHHLQLIFGAEHGRPTVELRLHTNRRHVHFAAAAGADHRSALDRVVAKVRRHLDTAPARRGRGAAQ
jgi:ribosome-associated translation inhibitor RaiA